MRLFSIVLPCLLILTFLSSGFHLQAGTQQVILPGRGTFDGLIGEQQVILFIEKSDNQKAQGFFIRVNNHAVERKIRFNLIRKKKTLRFESDEITGKITGQTDDNSITGKIKRSDQGWLKSLFRSAEIIQLTKRKGNRIPFSNRYKNPIFNEVDLQTGIEYARAKGLWTRTPYSDDPYIEVVAKGILNSLKKEDNLPLLLDLYQPKDDPQNLRPLILLIHGGGFYIGTREEQTMVFLADELAKRGYVVASIDYRLGFRMKSNEVDRTGYLAIQDAHAALRFLSNQSNTYRIDPHQVYVAGTSAGAVTALHLAFLDNDERPESVLSQKDYSLIEDSGNNLPDKFSIKAVANMWGAVNDTLIIDEDENIPVISFHGTDDHIVPYGYGYPFDKSLYINRLILNKVYGSSLIHQRLSHLGITNRLFTFNALGHEPQVDANRGFNQNMEMIKNEIVKFFHQQTIPNIVFPDDLLTFDRNSTIPRYNVAITNGHLEDVSVKGGVIVNPGQSNPAVIWFDKEPSYEITFITRNEYAGENQQSFSITCH